jgi:NarL family two-component system response regulator LiaR
MIEQKRHTADPDSPKQDEYFGIRVLVVDDHAYVREALRILLASEPDIEGVGEAGDGLEAVSMAIQLRPDVVLMDLLMPRTDGVAAIGALVQQHPTVRVLVLTGLLGDERIYAAIKAGAWGYVSKGTPPSDLVRAIQDVYAGRPLLQPFIAQRMIREMNEPSELPPTTRPLTRRETSVIKLLAQARTDPEISAALTIDPRELNAVLRDILDKLHVAGRTWTTLYALPEQSRR